MYCFILLFNLFHSSTTDFLVTGSWTLILCNVQLINNAREIFRNPGYILMLYSIIWTENRENTNIFEKKSKNRFKSKKSDLNQKSDFFIFFNHDFFQPCS